MIYFDTDVWIHYFFLQDPVKQATAVQKIQNAAAANQVAVSILCLQEVSFVMNRLGASKLDINQALTFLKTFIPHPVTLPNFQRAEIFAQSIGFQNINDCSTQQLRKQIAPNWSRSTTLILGEFSRSPI